MAQGRLQQGQIVKIEKRKLQGHLGLCVINMPIFFFFFAGKGHQGSILHLLQVADPFD
jgi:hypothetical protein